MTKRWIWALAACAAVMSATMARAQALDVCRLAKTRTFADASAALEASGCSVRREAGLTLRLFNCANDTVAVLESDKMGTLSVRLPANAVEALAKPCEDLTWRDLDNPYDNPLVLKLKVSVRSYDAARAAVIGIDPKTPFAVWLCLTGYGCRSGFDEKLASTMSVYFDTEVLNFTASQIRIAGFDIAKTRREAFEAALIERGGVGGAREEYDLVSSVVFNGVEGVPGLGEIKVVYVGDRIASVRYAIRAQEDYLAFSRSLDGRYGASKPTPDEGCMLRGWSDGGIGVLGTFCANKPDENGFSFMNTDAAAVIKGVNALFEGADTSTPAEKPASKAAKSDMY